ncbi:hypothetical protein ACFQE0_00615 [Methylobacterium komagatae]|uniref:Bro-N domain-containing protein n=1 Tax=Methylobacterium komagatae TaxID=374425 RepID=A0ABW2BDM8_9HYPH
MKKPDYDPTLTVLNFNPQIKGISRYFPVRVLRWEGSLWLLSKDAEAALGWSYGTLTAHLSTRLPGYAWGYANILTERGWELLRFVSLAGLKATITRTRERQSWAFRRWLDTLA